MDNLYCGDCLDVMKGMPDNSVDSIVTDPPYGIFFMSKKWDYDVPKVEIWQEALRILKPGGHLLCFAGTRTQHRMACNIEDAGFEIKNMLAWVFGSGFPKSLNVSKKIDQMAGAEREIIGENRALGDKKSYTNKRNKDNNNVFYLDYETMGNITVPATEEAKRWSGFGSGLKPAMEPITLARKPLSEPNIASNVLKHGTGSLNIDGCRIEIENREDTKRAVGGWNTAYVGGKKEKNFQQLDDQKGRWPANFIHDGSEEVEALFPDTESSHRNNVARHNGYNASSYNLTQTEMTNYCGIWGDKGGSASRFFYCAKASKEDRDENCDDIYTLNEKVSEQNIQEIKRLLSI